MKEPPRERHIKEPHERNGAQMRPFHLATCLALSALVLAGCGERSASPDRGTIITDSERLELQERVERRFEEMDRKLDELRRRASDATETARSRLSQLADELSRKKDDAARALRELRAAAAEQWRKLGKALEKAVDDLESAIRNAAG